MDKFSEYKEKVHEQLSENGYGSDSISNLLDCRDTIAGHLEYLRNLSVNYYDLKETEEAKYKQRRAEIVLAAANATRGAKEAELKEYEIKKDFTESEIKYKRIVSFISDLETRDDILKQRISHLKQEENLTKFLK